MKAFKLFMVLVLVALLLAVAGCGGNGGTGDSPNNEAGDSLVDENGDQTADEGDEPGGETVAPDVGVKVTPPDGWEKSESSALVQYTKGPSSFIVVREKIAGDINGLDGYLEEAKKQLAGTFSGIEFSSVERLKLDGYDGRKFFCTYEVANMPFKLIIIYVFRDGYIYNLQGCALAEDFDGLLPEFEAFISSFRFE